MREESVRQPRATITRFVLLDHVLNRRQRQNPLVDLGLHLGERTENYLINFLRELIADDVFRSVSHMTKGQLEYLCLSPLPRTVE